MLLRQLLNGIDAKVNGSADVSITGIAYDSRKVKPGFVFVAIPGFKVDGHRFIQQAIANGAVAVVLSDPSNNPADITTVQVENSRAALAVVSANFFNHPSRRLKVYGVTGTNGKTTTCHLLRAVFKANGYRVAVLGTIGNWLGDDKVDAARTTPEALDLQQLFSTMLEQGITHVVMEVSSHALELHRADQIDFNGAVFTNLSQDHLDFHLDMEDYLRSKGKLFSNLTLKAFSVLNADDAASYQYLRQLCKGDVLSYGTGDQVDLGMDNIQLRRDGVQFDLVWHGDRFAIEVQTPGMFTVYNAAAAIAVALKEGINMDVISRTLRRVQGVPGRFQQVNCGQDFTVVVDYAHTPDSLTNILSAAKEFTQGRLITVFGCGGDRDKGKRPLMGEAAAKLSDYVVVTSDNPRSEEPQAIIADILPGVKDNARQFKVIVDRAEAITHALSTATAGDVVIIAGKGHETYQEVKGRTLAFDDSEVAADILRRFNNA